MTNSEFNLCGVVTASISRLVVMDDWQADVIRDLPLVTSRHVRHRQNNKSYSDRESKRGTTRNYVPYNEQRQRDRLHRPFVGWDTEGSNVDATPFLFGNSEQARIAAPALGTTDMLDLILDAETENPNAIHVIYAGEYDVNMILREVPERFLRVLKATNHVQWEGYRIEHIPRKWFGVKKDKTTARIFDVVSFFGCAYVKALQEHKIGTDDELARIIEGKAGRSTFTYGDLDFIEPYWRTELKLLPALMDHLREAFYRAGSYIHYWHGPGALARHALRTQGIKNAMASSIPDGVAEAGRYAFCGGRFEPFQAGLHEGIIYNVDINSAYPYAATALPDLSRGEWVHSTNVDRTRIRDTQFAVYHIRYEHTNADRVGLCVAPQPLFRRYSDDRVMWPNTVTGWYWSPEAVNVIHDPHAEFLDGWIFVDDGSRPFSFVAADYRHRAALKRMGDPMQLTFKLKINSIYGQLAQRAGWERYKGPPTYHQLEWAGFITSMCRAMIYRAAMGAWEDGGLVSIDTDGIYSTTPLREETLTNGCGMELGQWEMATVPGMLFWQSGVYFTKNDAGEWMMAKARGAPKGQISAEAAFTALETLGDLKYTRSEMIGYRWGLRNGMGTWRYFIEKDRRIQFGGSEWSKRQHFPRGCRSCRGFTGGTLHDLSPVGNGFAYSNHSKMHVLPWAGNDHDRARDPIDLKSDMIIDAIWEGEG